MKREEIDKKIGMPDVDAEWKKFEQEHSTLFAENTPFATRQNAGISLRKIAAILVAVLMLTGFGYAAVRTSFFTKGWDEAPSNSPKGEDCQASVVNTNEKTPPLGEVGRGLDAFVLFQDARLDSILMLIDAYYKVESRFADEDLRQIRLLFKWQKQHSLDEVLLRLNGFERFQIRREENTLIVEQPQAEQ